MRNALRGYWLSRLHTQALIDRDREQTLTSKMIAHSRKAVDEDGRLCFCVVFFFITSVLPIKTDSFIHYFFAKKQHQLRLHICCTPDPQQSLRLFINPRRACARVTVLVNPRRACAARVTVVVLCVCMCVCMCVCPLIPAASHIGITKKRYERILRNTGIV